MKTAKQLGFPNPARPTADGAHMTVHDVTFTAGPDGVWELSRSQYDYPLDGADVLMAHPLAPALDAGNPSYVAVYRFFLAEQPNGFDYWQPMVHEWNFGPTAGLATPDLTRRA
jgi:hypothetical protein